MQLPTTHDLIKAGAHFGHKKDKSNPKATKQYSFGIRDGIYIIDLEKTKSMLSNSLDYIAKLVREDKVILFVGTKRQAQDAIKQIASDGSMPYISHRWLGGMLTNFETIRLGIKKLKNMEVKKETPEYEKMTKQERARFNRNLEKLQNDLNGIRNLEKLPDALFIVDVVDESVAVKEAKKNNIPIIGICDINANPDLIDHCIPANDDSKPTIELIMKLVGEKIEESKKQTTQKNTDANTK